MSSKKPAPTDDDILKQLDELAADDAVPTAAAANKKPSSTEADDVLAEFENLVANKPASRPHTPRVGANKTGTPPPGSPCRSSEDKSLRKSGESTRSFHNNFTPAASATSSDSQDAERREPVAEAAAASSGGGWWGSLSGVVSAVTKAADNAVKEIQENGETKRWAEQVKGNVGVLRGFGGEFSSRALPTFTSILNTLAPPISSHERLQIHVTHDFINYPSLSSLIHGTFARVMVQVEGGDLLVIQRGHESGARSASDAGHASQSSSGWSDGPWWRHNENRDLCVVKGLIEGTKLARVSAEQCARDYLEKRGGLEAAAQRATEELSASNPVRSSDIFMAVQAIKYDAPADLFQGPAKDTKEDTVIEEEKADELIVFALYLHDPIHSISYHTITQSIPSRWIRWLDASTDLTITSSNYDLKATTKTTGIGFFGLGGGDDNEERWNTMPEEIKEIIDHGGIDPREWVAEWVQDMLSLGVGVLAQRYVARRMGVGEGGIGKGKAKMEEVLGDGGGGEAARAGLI